ncbi:MAG TPA: hypothetical protein VEQ10_04545 [Vicinamibacteria bacterium]|nr:hypothetical protein [Vicinamibacteria bacterium]
MLDEFSVLFPVAPRVEATTVDMAGGRRAGMRMYQADEPNTQWLVSATDVARLGLDGPRTLSAARSGAIGKSGGRLTSERPVLIAHYEGLELRLERPDRTVVRIRLCVTPRRIYQLLVVTTEERKRLAQIQRFFESFTPE